MPPIRDAPEEEEDVPESDCESVQAASVMVAS